MSGTWSTCCLMLCRSRKRRTSENLMDDEEVMSECSAAMLLMKLSCSPQYANSLPIFDQYGRPSYYPSLPSPVDDSGASSFRSATPSPPLSSSTGTSSMADEGIVKDLFSPDQQQQQQQPRKSLQNTTSLKPVISQYLAYANTTLNLQCITKVIHGQKAAAKLSLS